ncbi:MAG: hypothetical protein ABSA78_19130 [Candidatus Sulfotelmatobacter sp.]
MFCRGWFPIAVCLGALLIAGQTPVFCQQNPTTVDQVIANHLLAIGGSDRIASITTFDEKGELSGDLTDFGQPFPFPRPLQNEHGTFEFYFKTPNLRFGVFRNNGAATMHGCDGAVTWYIGANAVAHEFKPKPGSEYECRKGFEPMPLGFRAPGVRLQLKGKKKVAGEMAWVVRSKNPELPSTDTYYFDAETYLLLRWETVGPSGLSTQGREFELDRTYSDYRDVGGMKLAFMVVEEVEDSKRVTILREVEINAPIDDARFRQPKIVGGPKNPHVVLENPSNPPSLYAESAPSAQPDKIEIPATVAPSETHVAPNSSSLVTTNFVSFSVGELEQIIPELRGLEAAKDEQALSTLLDQVGERTRELSQKTPNLIAHEEVVESEPGAKATREEFSYLMLARRNQGGVTLAEFRVDLKTGAKLETDDAWKLGAPGAHGAPLPWDDLALASQRANARAAGRPPLNEGYAAMWLRFYPANRSESTFRYLGQQEIDGHHTLVVAFAQKPDSVRLPAAFRSKGKSVPIYYQGVAWVDASDFRIVRMRMDLLSPVADLSLTQLTAEAQFADTQVAGLAMPLWLPREVAVTTQANGHLFGDKHTYSNYRSFQVHARILPDP